MRIQTALRALIVLLTLASAVLAHAQFQAPTDEELKMTADPKAPGAAAVYFYIEETTDDPLHFHSFYARIKVLEEKGKELATIEVPYERDDIRITDIKGRTIHADGTVIPLEVKPEDLLAVKVGQHQFNRKVFTLPSVEVGSILEYRYKVRYPDNYFSAPQWEVQRPYFVHEAHYAFTPFKAFMSNTAVPIGTLVDSRGRPITSLIWWSQLPPGAAVKTDQYARYRLDLTNIPASPREEWMPPASALNYRLLFYYKSSYGANDYWIEEAKRWSKDADHFAEPSGPVRQAVAGIVAPGDNDLDRARKLYKAVQALDNTNFSRKRNEAELKALGLRAPRRAEDTWAQKSGSSEDIALLYLAMVRAAGLTAYAMKVVDRDRGVFTPGYLEFDQLDDDIVVVTINGKEVSLDPGEKMCPFQMVHWKHTGTGGIRQSADGRAATTTPEQPYTANTLVRLGDLNLDSQGAVTGSFRFVMAGQLALYWRQQALGNDVDEVKKRYDEWLKTTVPTGINAHVDHFLEIDNPDANLMAVVKLDGTLGSATGRRILVPGFLFSADSRHPFIDEPQRQTPVDMKFAEQVTDQVVFHLPADFTIEAAPTDAKVPWGDRALLATRVKNAPGQVTIARQFSRGFVQVKPEDYPSLVDFYRKVAAADQQQLVLSAAPAAKGD